MDSPKTPTPLQIRITNPSGSPESQGESTAQSITVSQAINESVASKLETEAAALLDKAVESTNAAHDAVIGGNVVAGIIHSVAAASCFSAAANGLKLAKALREK